MRRKVSIQKDINEAVERFPKLMQRFDEKANAWLLEGDLDICDSMGEYWDTFSILIFIPGNYPHCVPKVIEKSKLIPREINRHISEDGVCCLDMDHKLLHMASRGIHLASFISEQVYPFFANQLYRDHSQDKNYASKEYNHNFKGVQQFYAEDLKIATAGLAVKVIERVLVNNIPGRNALCFCGSERKFKRCHTETIAFLRTLPADRLIKDLDGFLERDKPPLNLYP
ncbi:MAG: SEC-C metal-binding domain-containing protein [Tunicatimonas sp.]